MKNVAVAFFAGFFGVVALAIIFVQGKSTPAIISSLGGSLAQLGSSLETGSYNPNGAQF